MRTHGRGFSLVELVIVVVIIGIIAAIAVPRMTRASANASAGALRATLSHVRTAIDCYYAEHGKYPGYLAATGAPQGVAFVDQLLRYSNDAGSTSATPDTTYTLGPYLRSPFPVNPTNGLSTVFVKAAPGELDPAPGSYGWIAVLSHGYFGIFATDAELIDIGVTNPRDREDLTITLGL